MNIKIYFGLLMSSLLLLSCASTSTQQRRPQWIDNAAAVYLEQDYLTAVGQGGSRERAAKNALANLAEIFVVNVRAETNSLTQVSRQQSGLGVTAESSSMLQRDIQTETQQVISGAVIKDSWLSPSGEYYALALLNKRKAALSLTESILEMDDSTADLIDYSLNHAPNVISALNALRRARDLQSTRAIANLKLKQVSMSGIGNDISSAKIEKLIAEKLASLQVSVVVEDARHAQTIQSALARLGVQVAENADLQIYADIDMVEPSFINGWYWLRGSYELSVLENAKVISRKRWPMKVSAKQEELLLPRLLDKVDANIANYLNELLSDSVTL